MKKLLILFLLLMTSVYSADRYNQNQLLFCLKKDVPHLDSRFEDNELITNNQKITQLFREYGVIKIQRWLPGAGERDVVDDVKLTNIYEITFQYRKSAEELQQILRKFRIIDEVHSADLEAINKISSSGSTLTPSDIYYDRQWYINKIMADQAWALWGDNIPGDSTIIIGVVDTGIDYLHPDLQEALFVNLGEDINGDGKITEADKNGVDDDGNDYIDDFMGWDFAGITGNGEDNDVRPPEAGPTYDLSHGTHVAGIAAATANNGIGIAGVSFQSKVVATKHAPDDDLSDPGLISTYSGILYCAQMGAQIINCSWGGGYDFYGKLVVDNVTKNYNAIVVCAAGNDGTDSDSDPHYPSDYDNSIAVGSTTIADKKAYYSNYGDIIDISAPGGEGSSYSNAIYSLIHDDVGAYRAFQGTSMASPVAAGCFALLKAWFPDSSREWLVDKLIASADPIDDVNPNYQGKLGSGRVNIYNAIAQSIMPSLTIEEFVYEVIDANNDGGLNPGEGGRLSFLIKNAENWKNAEDVVISAGSSSPFVTFSDSTSLIGNIVNGDIALSNSDEIVFQISENATYEPIEVIVKVTANPNSESPFENSEMLQITLSLNQQGFPKTTTAVSVPVAIENLLDDTNPEIISVGGNDSLYVHQFNGSLLSGFPVFLGGYTSMGPAIADMDNDGQKEIVIAARSGLVKVVEADGAVLSETDISEQIFGNLSIANMDDDPELEIVFGTMLRNLHVINFDGSPLPGFPKAYPFPIDKGIALADLNGDNIPEMIFGLFNAELHVLTAQGDSLLNFPIYLNTRISTTPVILKTGTDFKIIFSATDGTLNIANLDGVVESSYQASTGINSSPGLCDADNDGNIEIYFGTEAGEIHAVGLSGDTLINFPKMLDSPIRTSPIFADFNNDDFMEIVITSALGRLYIFDKDGNLYDGFPALVNGDLNGTAGLADIDRDGDFEVISGGSQGLWAFDVQGQKGSRNFWQTYLGNNRRTGYYGDAVTAIQKGELNNLPGQFQLFQNYPNPFNPSTTISFYVPAQITGSDLTLDVYNLLGQKVTALFQGLPKTGYHNVEWDGRTSKGVAVPSGFYVYRLHGKNVNLTKRMLFIK